MEKLILVFLSLLHYQVVDPTINVTSLRYDVDVSSRFAVTVLDATFRNLASRRSNATLQFLLPENAFISSFSLKMKNKIYTSVIQSKSVNVGGKNAYDTILIQHRHSRAQKLTMKPELEGDETFALHLTYVELLRRTKGLYNIILYFPQKRNGNLHLAINARVAGDIKSLHFLEAPGREEPLVKVAHGTAEIFSSHKDEVLIRYKRNGYYNSNFTATAFTNPKIKGRQLGSLLSLNPLEKKVPNIYSVDPALVLSYDVHRHIDGGEIQIQNGYFVHFISPEGLSKLPIHTVFALDISGSMDEKGKLASLKTAMKTTLRSFKPEDSFEIFVFSNIVKSLGRYEANLKNIRDVIGKIDSLLASGGTNINDALLEAVKAAYGYTKALGTKQIVFLTDGNRTVGELEAVVIRRRVHDANRDSVPIYALAFGNDADMKFLRKLSGENRGFARKVRSERRQADQLREFYKDISTPLLANLSVTYEPHEVEKDSLFKVGKESFYSGDEVVVTGKLATVSGSLTPKVSGMGANGRIQLKVSRKNMLPSAAGKRPRVLERLWAYLAVQDLLASQELVDDKNMKMELRARALEIALQYHFVTRLTTLVMDSPHILSDASSHDGIHHDSSIHGLALLAPEEFAETLPSELQVDNDPHFVMQIPGLALPLCFDFQGKPGDILNLVRDYASGFIVNAEVTAALARPGGTYFTRIFIAMQKLNLTITTDHFTVNCVRGDKQNEVLEIWHESDPIDKRRRVRSRNRRYYRRQRSRLKRKTYTKSEETNIDDSIDRELTKSRGHLHSGARATEGATYLEEEILPVIDAYLEKRKGKNGDRKRYLEARNSRMLSTNHSKFSKMALDLQEEKKSGKYEGGSTRKTNFEFIPKECEQTFRWSHLSRRRYDNVVLSVVGRAPNRRRLHIVVGDVILHLVVTNSRNRNGQAFLGFYIQEQKILSKNTTGIIGQFLYKSVSTIGHYPELVEEPANQERREIPLSVVHFPRTGRTVKVTGIVTRRRSLLHREKMLCLLVKKSGKGLLDQRQHYLMPDIAS